MKDINHYASARSLRGKHVYMNESGVIWAYRFIRWVRTPMHTGREDTNDIGVGALVYVPWRCGPPFNRRPPSGFTKGHFVLRAYRELYYTGSYQHRRIIKRPPPERVKMYRDSR